jgi:hypothetical protein|tara:strand:- start:13821 stop:14105 length:285 start_codon:yes stop_codon:yes gene_type:complete
LSKSLRKSKDLFTFGCTTGLRVSDLFALKKTNLEKLGESYYIRQQSKKTNTATKIKLPSYAVTIVRVKNDLYAAIESYFGIIHFLKRNYLNLNA